MAESNFSKIFDYLLAALSTIQKIRNFNLTMAKL